LPALGRYDAACRRLTVLCTASSTSDKTHVPIERYALLEKENDLLRAKLSSLEEDHKDLITRVVQAGNASCYRKQSIVVRKLSGSLREPKRSEVIRLTEHCDRVSDKIDGLLEPIRLKASLAREGSLDTKCKGVDPFILFENGRVKDITEVVVSYLEYATGLHRKSLGLASDYDSRGLVSMMEKEFARTSCHYNNDSLYVGGYSHAPFDAHLMGEGFYWLPDSTSTRRRRVWSVRQISDAFKAEIRKGGEVIPQRVWSNAEIHPVPLKADVDWDVPIYGLLSRYWMAWALLRLAIVAWLNYSLAGLCPDERLVTPAAFAISSALSLIQTGIPWLPRYRAMAVAAIVFSLVSSVSAILRN
jgi:hypothetical protein